MLQAAIRASIEASEKDQKFLEGKRDEAVHDDSKADGPQYGNTPPEPESGGADVTTIAFRFPDGKRIKRRFHKDGNIAGVFAFVKETVNENISFEIRTTYPPKSLANDLEQSIAEAGISGSSLIVKFL